MRLGIVTSFPFPRGKATANRVRVFAEELEKNPYIDQVKIFCCSDLPTKTYHFTETIKIANLYTMPASKRNLLIRAINELSSTYKLWRNTQSASLDIIIVTVPSIMLLLPMALSRRKSFLVLDIRDAVWTYLPDSLFYNLAKKIMALMLRLAAKKVDMVTVTNSSEALSVKSVTNIDPIVLANGISNTRVTELLNIPLRESKDKLELSYIGNIGIAQELDSLLELAKVFNDSLGINFIGDGASLKALQFQCKQEAINNVKFFGEVSPDEVPQYMSSADILFAQIGQNFSSAIPTKIFEYISAGRKILLGLPEGPAKEIFKNFYGVEIFHTGQFSEMESAFRRLVLQSYTSDHRELNLERLKKNFIRENTILNFSDKLNEQLSNLKSN